MLPWQQHRRCHSVSFVMYISGAKFEEHCSSISTNKLFLIQCFTVQVVHTRQLILKIVLKLSLSPGRYI